jgi:NTP pyrophosphatase (non-canonical NTP hydrolase)
MIDYLDDFQVAARKTAIYPAKAMYRYPALGLLGVIGEVANKVKKITRDEGGVPTEVSKAAVAKELSDCMWYAAAVASDYGLLLSGTCDTEGNIRSRENESDDLDYHILRMGEAVGRLCSDTTCVINDSVVLEMTRSDIQSSLNIIVSYAMAIAYLLGTDLEAVCKLVIKKLEDRAQRGVLQGSGDNR